ncbi:transposase [Agrobacterium rhizogenes]|nr:transposase [Rhizobium rhizogenes]NTI26668.1 transposase [Rhizobium rhizogenes]
MKDRRLCFFPGDTPPENFVSFVGKPINTEQSKANWNDILRLVTAIRSGQIRRPCWRIWPSSSIRTDRRSLQESSGESIGPLRL